MKRTELVEGHYRKTGFYALSVMIGTAVMLFVMSAPLFIAEIAAGNSRETLAHIQTVKHNVSLGKMTRSLNSLNAALKWEPNSQEYIENRISISLGIYEYFLSHGEQNSKKARKLLETIDDLIVDALVKFPSNSNLWYLLGEVRVRLTPSDERIFDYLKMSYMTGPREGWIASRRLLFALRNWRQLDADNQRYAINDINLLWAEAPYHKYLGEIFLKSSINGRRLIYGQINKRGRKDVLRFRKTLMDLGWKSKNNILHEVMLRKIK